jgi:predicted DNA-binding transcriptional regulator AlpA
VTVASLISFSKSKVYKLMKDGDFPRPVKIGAAARWRAVDVQKWLHEHGGRDGEALAPLPDLERTLGNTDNLAKAVVRLAGQVKAQMAQHDAQWARSEAQTLMLKSILAALNIPGPQPVVTVKTQAVEAAGPEAVASNESRTPESDLRRASKHTMFPRKSLASPDLVSPGEAYRRAWEFFGTRIGVPSEHALPYANHIHALTRILCRLPNPTENEWEALERWFWRTSASGVGGWSAGMMTSVAEAVATPGSGQKVTLDVPMVAPAPDLWIRQPFRQVSGYAKTLTLALALMHPKDLLTGQEIDTSKALTWLHADGLRPLFPISFLKARKVTGAKAWALANFIFLSPRSSEKIKDKPPSQYLARALDQHGDVARQWLLSNLVDDTAIDAALIDDYEGFLVARAATIDAHICRLAGWD